MKWLKTEYNGFSSNQNQSFGEGAGGAGTPLEKTMGVLSGNAKVYNLSTFMGTIKLWVDEDGTIIRGPDILIGTEFDKVKKIPSTLLMDILLAAGKGVSTINNDSHSPAEREASKQFENAKVRLSKALGDYSTSRYEKIAPGTTAR